MTRRIPVDALSIRLEHAYRGPYGAVAGPLQTNRKKVHAATVQLMPSLIELIRHRSDAADYLA